MMVLSCDSRESKFHQFLRQTQRNQILNIYDTLILPIQRIPRYQLLLSAVHSYISRSPDFSLATEKLSETINLIISINYSIDHALKIFENTKQMEELKKIFSPDFRQIFNENIRIFIKRGSMKGFLNDFYLNKYSKNPTNTPSSLPTPSSSAASSNSNSEISLIDFKLFIFDDQMILATRENKVSKLSVDYSLPISSTFLFDTSTPDSQQFSIQFVNLNFGFTFYPQNKTELVSWKSTFKKVLASFLEKNPNYQGMALFFSFFYYSFPPLAISNFYIKLHEIELFL